FSADNIFVTRTAVVNGTVKHIGGMQILGVPLPGAWQFTSLTPSLQLIVDGQTNIAGSVSATGSVNFLSFSLFSTDMFIQSGMGLNVNNSVVGTPAGHGLTMLGSGSMSVFGSSTFDGGIKLQGTSHVSVFNTG